MPRGRDESYDGYVQILIDGLTAVKTQEEIATELQVARSTLIRWNKIVDWDFIKAERRKKYAMRMIDVDDSMFKQAIKKGDVSAAKYLAERFDDFIPMSAMMVSKNDPRTDPEIEDRIHAINAELAARETAKLNNTGEEATTRVDPVLPP